MKTVTTEFAWLAETEYPPAWYATGRIVKGRAELTVDAEKARRFASREECFGFCSGAPGSLRFVPREHGFDVEETDR